MNMAAVQTINPGKCPHCGSYRYRHICTRGPAKYRRYRRCLANYSVRTWAEMLAEQRIDPLPKVLS